MEPLVTAEIDRVLESVGYGFLGLAVDDRPYVVPMSFGYTGEIYFQMNAQGRKHEFIEPPTPACLTVFQYDPEADRSTSVLVEGHLEPVPDEELGAAFDALASNAKFGTDLSIWGVPIQEADPRLYVLEPSHVAGRRFGEGAAQ